MLTEKIPFFSVIVPLYNKEKHIKETIQSVLDQSYQGFEILVVDDGSTDHSVAVVESISDSRIKLLKQENAGVSAARNKGIKESRTEYLAFLDGDDIWMSNHLEIIYNMIVKFPHAGMYSTAYELKQNDLIKKLRFTYLPTENFEGIIPDYFKTLFTGDNPTCSSVVVIKNEIFKEIGKFPIGVRMGEDLDTWIRIGMKYEVCFSTKVTAQYNIGADNRACNIYTQKDLNSIMLTKWFDYSKQSDSEYLKLFIKKTQLNYIYNMIIGGLGRDVRKVILPIFFQEYGFKNMYLYYLLSFFNLSMIEKIRNIKHRMKGLK